MRWLGAGLTLLGIGAGCTSSADLLQADIDRLSSEVRQLQQETRQLQRTLRRARTANEPQGNAPLPADFDPEKPLPTNTTGRPDVIVLSVDTLRADHLGAWGYHRPTSPFLDRLAAEGTRFSSAWSPSPWTLPAHATLLSGRLPRNHGAIEDHVSLPTNVPLLQEHFQASGYATAGVVATLFVSSRFGFDRGFDFFHDFGIQDARVNNAGTVDAEHVFAWALDWAQEQAPDQPIFLFLHIYDVHFSYNAPEPWNTLFNRAPVLSDPFYRTYAYYTSNPLTDQQMEHQVAQYDEEIAYVDDTFRGLIERWTDARPQTLVAVTADHGEEFGERGSWGHAHTLYPEQLHIPMILWGPGVSAQHIDHRVGLEDVAPTLAGLAQVPFAAPDGVDRSAQVQGATSPTDPHIAAQFAETSRFTSLQYRWHEPPWDLILDLRTDTRFLCNLQNDPDCAEDLTAQEPERADQMLQRMLDWLGESWEATAAGEITVEDGEIYQGTTRIHPPRLNVRPGDRFGVHPLDAIVHFTPEGQPNSQGPWRIIGGETPDPSAPLQYHGARAEVDPVNLSDEEREMLQSLGYIQE